MYLYAKGEKCGKIILVISCDKYVFFVCKRKAVGDIVRLTEKGFIAIL